MTQPDNKWKEITKYSHWGILYTNDKLQEDCWIPNDVYKLITKKEKQALAERLKIIEKDLHELRLPACSLLAVKIWNLIAELEEK
jgi:hypothetical protein